MQEERLKRLPTRIKFLKMDINFDLDKERECFSCLYDLHLSAVGCTCSPNKYSCLKHSNSFCSCGVDKRFVLLRYTINELNKLVEALEGVSDAIGVWTKRNSVMVSMDAKDVCMDRGMCRTKIYNVESSSRCAGTKKLKFNERSSPCSHVSSDLVQSEFQVQSASHGTVDSFNDNAGKNSVMVSGVKVKEKCSLDLNSDVFRGQNENDFLHIPDSQTKGIGCVKKVGYSDSTKEQDIVVLDVEGNLPCLSDLLQKGYPSCSRDVHSSSKFEVGKLLGVDRPMHTRVPPSNEFKIEAVDTFNTSLPLTNQSSLIQKFAKSVEAISLGSVVYGKLWCSKHTIYPKGMRQNLLR